MMCVCCGSERLQAAPVLWRELAAQWRLAPYEQDYLDLQQGLHCLECGVKLRGMALAAAVMACLDFEGLFKEFIQSPLAANLRLLEINEADGLSPYLRRLPKHLFRGYPELDMMAMPFADGAFDVVVHSDTLEHVPDPVRGLSECRRVLQPGGFCAFTIPMVVDRLTCSRDGLPGSYHGNETNPDDYQVVTEYGADAWRHVMQARFRACRIFSLDYPAAQALIGVN